MSDNHPTPAIKTETFYVKNQHFDSPSSPIERMEQFKGHWQPKVDFTATIEARRLKDTVPDRYEVSLLLEVHCKQDNEVIYHCRVTQAGVFLLTGLDEMTHKQVVNGYCASVLFPYACERVNNTVIYAGFPPAGLGPVHFEQLVKEALEKENLNAGSSTRH